MAYFIFAGLIIVVAMIVAGLPDSGDAVVVRPAKPMLLYMRQAEQVAADAERTQRNSEVESTLAAIEALLAKCRQGGDEEKR